MRNGADVNLLQGNGWTPIQFALWSGNTIENQERQEQLKIYPPHAGSEKIADLLIRSGANISHVLNHEMMTLQTAAYNGTLKYKL